MTTTGIRETIAAAADHERKTGQLRQNLERRLPELQEKLVLPTADPVDALMQFVHDYIESVPGFINLVTALSKRLGFYDYAAPFLHMAEDYFLQPPDELPTDTGLEALLDEAFLAHRLMEEVNDHHVRQMKQPLLPLDMTEANIIVHHLLGDELATRLERLVQFAASHLLDREYVWDRARELAGSEIAPAPLLCSNDLSGSPQKIRLRISGYSPD
jgi:hypothetical protein